MNSIKLENVLPTVFAGSEHDEPVASSSVWCHKLEFRRPDSYMIEAESGTGKSSLCAYIYGSRRDYSGSIRFNDRDIRTFSMNDWCELRRHHIAYLPQEMRLFPELTVMENIMVKNRLTDTFSANEIVDLLTLLGIENKVNQPAGRLSVGQQQRVAILRAIAQPFDFIILDEPVSHLDRRNNNTVSQLIADVARRNDASIITTSVGNPLLIKDIEGFHSVQSIKL
ncbi:MAG: ATP-binding cassette domain-containing protein [Muribaculaceae bacterium]|nr:ATP-binding cassette domain-containing protein [Muribaculaceae bacterium]